MGKLLIIINNKLLKRR